MDQDRVNTPGQQDVPTSESTPDQQAATTPAPQQDDYKKRFDGAILKIQQLSTSVKDLEGQLVEKSSLVEQLSGQLSSTEAEKEALIGQQKTEYEKLKGQFEEAGAEISKLQALRTKLEVAQELGQPDLISIFDSIPDSNDKDKVRSVMETVVNFASGQVKAREQQLTSGVTPSSGTSTITAPTSIEEWNSKIGALPEGSQERKEAWDSFYDWTLSQK